MDSKERIMAPVESGKVERRTPRSIRFYDSEWERLERFAEMRGLAAAEFVRFAALGAVEGGDEVEGDRDRLAPLLERTFRYSYMMATRMRDEMLGAGRDEELEVLVAAARRLQDELLEEAPDGR